MVDRAYLEGPCNVIASEEHPTLLWKAGFGSRLCLGAMSFGRGWSLRHLLVQWKIAFIAKMHPSILSCRIAVICGVYCAAVSQRTNRPTRMQILQPY